MDPIVVDATITSLAGRSGMALSTHQLETAGISRSQIQRRVGHLLIPVTDGVYIVGPPTRTVLLRATLLALPRAVASSETAGVGQGLPVPETEKVSVLMTGRRSRRHIKGVAIHHTRWLPSADVTTVDGLAMTTVARTLCDLSGGCPAGRLRFLIEHAIAARLTTATEIQACLLGWCRRGRAGSANLRRVGQFLLDGEPVPASELERRAGAVFRRAGLPSWSAQFQPPWYDGRRGVVDMAWPAARLVVELDGRRWHATTQAMADDRRRDRLAAHHGWLTLRFGWQEIVERPNLVTDEVHQALHARVRRPEPGTRLLR